MSPVGVRGFNFLQCLLFLSPLLSLGFPRNSFLKQRLCLATLSRAVIHCYNTGALQMVQYQGEAFYNLMVESALFYWARISGLRPTEVPQPFFSPHLCEQGRLERAQTIQMPFPQITEDSSKVIFLEGRLLPWKQSSGYISKWLLLSPPTPPPPPHPQTHPPPPPPPGSPNKRGFLCHLHSGNMIELLEVKPTEAWGPPQESSQELLLFMF